MPPAPPPAAAPPEARGADAHRSPTGLIAGPAGDRAAQYDTLDPSQIVKTVGRIEGRIAERFPDSGLRRVCGKLHSVAGDAGRRSRSFGRPILWLRGVVWLLVVSVAVSLAATVVLMVRPPARDVPAGNREAESDPAAVRPPVRVPVGREEGMGFADFVQVLEAGINDVVLIGAALLFLVTLENRTKRRRALAAIHELRAMAHIIDMHQLTKDPERVLHPELVLLEPRGDADRLTPFDLCRYLDYCSDMLSLIGKVAALYVQHFDDAQALAAVNEVENLCTGLSRKIWQKIMIVETVTPRGGS